MHQINRSLSISLHFAVVLPSSHPLFHAVFLFAIDLATLVGSFDCSFSSLISITPSVFFFAIHLGFLAWQHNSSGGIPFWF